MHKPMTRSFRCTLWLSIVVGVVISSCALWAQQGDVASSPPINLTIMDTPVAEVMAMLSEAAGVNIVVGQDVTENVKSVSLRDVTLEQALRLITLSTGLNYYQDDSGYIVTKAPLPPEALYASGASGSRSRGTDTLPPQPSLPQGVSRPAGSVGLVVPMPSPTTPGLASRTPVAPAPHAAPPTSGGPEVPTSAASRAIAAGRLSPALPPAAAGSRPPVSPLGAALIGSPPNISSLSLGVPRLPAEAPSLQGARPSLDATASPGAVTSTGPAPPAGIAASQSAAGAWGTPPGTSASQSRAAPLRGAAPPASGRRGVAPLLDAGGSAALNLTAPLGPAAVGPAFPSAPTLPPVPGGATVPTAPAAPTLPGGPAVPSMPPAPPAPGGGGIPGAGRGALSLPSAPSLPTLVHPAPSAQAPSPQPSGMAEASPVGAENYSRNASAVTTPEGGVAPTAPIPEETQREIALLPIKHADPREIALMLGGTVSEETTRTPVAYSQPAGRRAKREALRSTSDVFRAMGTYDSEAYYGQQFGGRGGGRGGFGGGGLGGGFGAGGRTSGLGGGLGAGFGGTRGGLAGGGVGGVGAAGFGMRPPGIDQIIAYMPQNSLLVAGSPAAIDQLREILAILDQPTKQVEISTKFIEVDVTKDNHFGIDWFVSNGSLEFFNLGFAPGEAVNNVVRWARGKFEANMGIVLNENRGTIITEPHITTQNNMPGYISFYTTIPYFTAEVTYNQFGNREVTFTEEEVDVEQTLEVTPRINADDTVTMYLTPIIEDQGPDVVGPNGERIPIIASQELETQVTVADGETIVLGGIIRKRETYNTKTTPLLSQIPIIGELFRQKLRSVQDTETLVFVTPRIMRDIPAP